MSKITSQDYTELADGLLALSKRYHEDENFHTQVNNGDVDFKQEFGLDVGDKELVLKQNSDDVQYFVITQDASRAICESYDMYNIVGAKSSIYDDLSFEGAQGLIGFWSTFSGVIAIVGILGGALTARDISNVHPEYFYEGTSAIKTSAAYYADH